MGIIDRIAPGLAARRAEARLRLDMAETRRALLQRYDAATRGGRHAGRVVSASSANAEIQTGLVAVRNAARDLVRNNPHANRAVRVLKAHIAGEGMRPRPVVQMDDDAQAEDLRSRARDQWRRFVENCDIEGRLDFYGQQRLAVGAVVEGGEALRVWFTERRNGRTFWRCRILEGDWLDHTRNEELKGGGRIVQGVEYDAVGRRVAYWLHTRDPGDRYGGLLSARSDVTRVDAYFVDHIYEVLRPGQARGMSWFAPVVLTLRDLDELAEAELVRKKLEACISMVIHNSGDDAGAAPALAGVQDDNGAPLTDAYGAPVERMRPGMVLEARPGWDVAFNAPPASEGLVEHMRERLQAVAAGVGVTYAQLTGDLSGANYSSMREGRLEFERLLDSWQADLMIVQSGRPAWQRVMDLAVADGVLPFAPRAEWTPPKRPWVDPMKDIRAAREEVAAGWASDQDMIERLGRDPDVVLAERREWRDKQARAGLGTQEE